MEFAIVALPFFALLFGILELGLIFMASTTIDAATAAVARQIRTGQFQSGASDNVAGFKSAVCGAMSWISVSDCMSNLSVDVRTFASFASIASQPPVKNGQIDQSQLTFSPGAACDIVLVRVFYPWTLLAPLLEPGLPDLGSGQHLITSTVAFRNENFSNGPPCS
ncbi:MAG TPA: TadE/TadG family type IV pilus assembly protein [Caulobacteraceae bacterium]|nr:TadE/TadG family type IV pilus assembly protein [Caulobacteraceae bacterium]